MKLDAPGAPQKPCRVFSTKPHYFDHVYQDVRRSIGFSIDNESMNIARAAVRSDIDTFLAKFRDHMAELQCEFEELQQKLSEK